MWRNDASFRWMLLLFFQRKMNGYISWHHTIIYVGNEREEGQNEKAKTFVN